MVFNLDSKTATIAGIGVAIGALLASYVVFQYVTASPKEIRGANPKAKKSSPTPAAASSTLATEVVREDTECLKGYKTTSDGRKTSYFNRELSELDKQLLGDCKPKKISSVGAVRGDHSPTRISDSSSSGSGSGSGEGTCSPAKSTASGWNTAGTWEEKTSTVWGQEQLTTLLEQLEYATQVSLDGTAYEVTLSVTGVSSVDGEIYVAFTRGKKLYLYDLKVRLGYELRVAASTGAADSATGTLVVSDISPDDDNFEYEVSPSSGAQGGLAKLPSAHAKQLLQSLLRGKACMPLKQVVEQKKAGSFVGGATGSCLQQEFVNCFAEFLCRFHAQ
jgi:hypothetical protein